jgi:hypothetical protein
VKKYLEIVPDSGYYIEVPSNVCSGICIDNKVLEGKNSSVKEGDFTFLNRRNFDKIAIWQFNSEFIFDDSELTEALKEFRE